MPKQRKSKSKIGRPAGLGKGATYVTVKLREDQLKAIRRIACPGGRPGGMPGTIRDLLDVGLKLARSRATRC